MIESLCSEGSTIKGLRLAPGRWALDHLECKLGAVVPSDALRPKADACHVHTINQLRVEHERATAFCPESHGFIHVGYADAHTLVEAAHAGGHVGGHLLRVRLVLLQRLNIKPVRGQLIVIPEHVRGSHRKSPKSMGGRRESEQGSRGGGAHSSCAFSPKRYGSSSNVLSPSFLATSASFGRSSLIEPVDTTV